MQNYCIGYNPGTGNYIGTLRNKAYVCNEEFIGLLFVGYIAGFFQLQADSDVLDGNRHQKFIFRLDSGQTLLISDNIGIATKITQLSVANRIDFMGEYEWNDKQLHSLLCACLCSLNRNSNPAPVSEVILFPFLRGI